MTRFCWHLCYVVALTMDSLEKTIEGIMTFSATTTETFDVIVAGRSHAKCVATITTPGFLCHNHSKLHYFKNNQGQWTVEDDAKRSQYSPQSPR